MTEHQFELKFQHIEEQREAKQEAVDGWYDQQLSRLFEKSGWTQQRIADKVGKSVTHVSRLLIFGRFLEFTKFSPSGGNPTVPANLTERAFRKYWEATEKHPKEDIRFQEVINLMESDSVIESKPKTRKAAVLAACSDGKFHSVERIAELAGIEVDEAKATIGYLQRRPSGVRVEHNGSKVKPKYKIKPGSGKVIDFAHVLDEIEPFLQDLERQGKCESMAEYAPSTILMAVNQLRKKLRELSM